MELLDFEDDEELKQICEKRREEIVPLQKQINQIHEKYDIIRNKIYDKKLKRALQSENISNEKCEGEIYANLLKEYINICTDDYDALTLDGFIEEYSNFISEK